MSNKSKMRKKPADHKPRQPASRDIPVALLATLGLALTTALLVISMTKTSLPYCNAGSGCDVVQSSRWSTLLGLPIAAWGWGVYLVITCVAWFARRKAIRWHLIIFFATVAFGVSVYLNAISIWVIEALCAYCLVSLGLISLIYGLSWRTSNLPGIGNWRFASGFVMLLVVGLMHLNYAGVFNPAAGPEDPYLQALAEHLSVRDAIFYGAYWCPHCQQQKLLFGASAHRLPYVECSPNGRAGAPATSCLAANIRNYPTWVIAGRRLDRILGVAQLARYSGFQRATKATSNKAVEVQ